MNVEFDSRFFNETFFPFIEDETRNQFFFGGSSSGKSTFILSQRTPIDMLKGRSFLITRKVAKYNRLSTFNEVKKGITAFKLHRLFEIRDSDLTITCLANGAQAFFVGLDEPEKLKSITPLKGVFTDIIQEEATENTEEDDIMLDKRLRGITPLIKRNTRLFNPIYQTHWMFKKHFMTRFNGESKIFKDDQYLIHHSTYKDNLRFLSSDDVYALEHESNPYYYDVYTLGKWGVLGKLIFTNYEIRDLRPIMSSFDNIRNGLDFGFSNDPTGFVRLHIDKAKKEIYILNTFYVKGLTNQQIAVKLRTIIHDEPIWCDCAEPKSIAELQIAGVAAYAAKKGTDSVLHGIQWLQGFKIIIHSQLQDYINEITTYQWTKDKNGIEINTPVDKNNHLIDPTRYALERDMVRSSNFIEAIGPTENS